jgi:hypothetical protein
MEKPAKCAKGGNHADDVRPNQGDHRRMRTDLGPRSVLMPANFIEYPSLELDACVLRTQTLYLHPNHQTRETNVHIACAVRLRGPTLHFLHLKFLILTVGAISAIGMPL